MQKLLGTKTPFCQILFDTYHSEILWDLAQWPKMIVTASWGVPHWRLQALINSYQTRAHFKRALRVQGPWCGVAGLLASFGLEKIWEHQQALFTLCVSCALLDSLPYYQEWSSVFNCQMSFIWMTYELRSLHYACHDLGGLCPKCKHFEEIIPRDGNTHTTGTPYAESGIGFQGGRGTAPMECREITSWKLLCSSFMEASLHHLKRSQATNK